MTEEIRMDDASSRYAQDTGRDWSEDQWHENGNYVCVCVRCDKEFVGHKRRVVCRRCAGPVEA